MRRLAAALDDVKDGKLSARRDYWQGFAFWRRALNGFNETPASTDLRDDLKSAVAEAYADGTLAAVPDWHYVRDILVPQIEALPAAQK